MILDNYGTHKTAKVRQWRMRRWRFHCQFTPTCSFWSNLVERFFAGPTEHQLWRGPHRSVVALEKTICDCPKIHNERQNRFAGQNPQTGSSSQ